MMSAETELETKIGEAWDSFLSGMRSREDKSHDRDEGSIKRGASGFAEGDPLATLWEKHAREKKGGNNSDLNVTTGSSQSEGLTDHGGLQGKT